MTRPINQAPHIAGARLPIERIRDVKFAKRLRRLMSEQELSQSALAAAIWGRHTSSEGKYVARGRDRISVWVSGKNFPDRENLEKLAEALKVKVTDLAPQAELKRAHSVVADWSVTKPHGETGMSFFQVARYVPDDIAHEIIGLLIKADQHQGASKPSRRSRDGGQQ